MLKSENIKLIVVHCSDTPDSENIGAFDIHKMHLDFGWDGIGYHKIIRRNGQVENGRPEYWQGAHLYKKNHESIGICLIGRKNFTQKQFKSLEKVLKKWKSKYPQALILGHYQATETQKTCPNFNVISWCKERKII